MSKIKEVWNKIEDHVIVGFIIITFIWSVIMLIAINK